MSIQVIAEGTVITEPAPIESARGHVVVFVLGTRHELIYRNQSVELDGLETCEVVCLGDLAATALQIHPDQKVIVTGTLRITTNALTMGEDAGAQLVRLEIHASDLSPTA